MHRTFIHSLSAILPALVVFIIVAQGHKTNSDFLGMLHAWTIAVFGLLVVFAPLADVMSKGFRTIFGVFYLVSITAFVIMIRMRQTVEAFG